MKEPISTFEALSLLVKAHQIKILAGLKNRFDNHMDEIQRFTVKRLVNEGEKDTDASFDFDASNVKKFVFNITREIQGKRLLCSDHVVTVVPSSSVYGFTVTAAGGGNVDLAGKPAYHKMLVDLFTKKLRAPVSFNWKEPDLHVPTFCTGPDGSHDPLTDVW